MQWYAPACGSHPMTPAVRRGSVIRCSEAYAERDQDGSGNASITLRIRLTSDEATRLRQPSRVTPDARRSGGQSIGGRAAAGFRRPNLAKRPNTPSLPKWRSSDASTVPSPSECRACFTESVADRLVNHFCIRFGMTPPYSRQPCLRTSTPDRGVLTTGVLQSSMRVRRWSGAGCAAREGDASGSPRRIRLWSPIWSGCSRRTYAAIRSGRCGGARKAAPSWRAACAAQATRSPTRRC